MTVSGQRWFSSAAVTVMAAAAVAVAAIAAGPRAARAQQPAPAPGAADTRAATATAPPPAVILIDVDTLLQAVRDPNGLPIGRDEAARRLVTRQAEPEAAKAIDIGLNEVSNRDAQAALARALAEHPQPDPQFATALGTLLTSPNTAEPAAAALLKFPAERPRLLSIAQGVGLDASRREARPAVIRGLGGATDRRTLTILAELASNAGEPPTVRNAAADALATATGQRGSGAREPERWRNWLAVNRDKSDAQFEADLLAARSNRLDKVRSDYDRLAGEARALLVDQYRRTPEAARADVLVSYLRSVAPEVRTVGVRLIRDAVIAADNIPAAAREQLIGLIGDSTAEVRLEVATLLGLLNEAAALEPLLDQVVREPDANVRAAQAAALGPTGDLRAVPVLLRLVTEPNPTVAEAAADSLQPLGRKLRQERPRDADAAAATIAGAIQQPPATTNDRLRVALLEAAATLQSADLRHLYRELMRPNQPTVIRVAAVRAMGALGTDWAARMILENGMLEDATAAVREATVEALLTSADMETAERLYQRLQPTGEPNAAIRQKIWNTLSILFRKDEFRPEDLNRWADRFKDDTPEDLQRRLTILLELKRKLQQAPDREPQLAVAQQNLGEHYMKLARYEEAVAELATALDHYREQQGEDQTTQALIAKLMQAHLKTKNYEKAANFAAQEIARSATNQDIVGPPIIGEADALRDRGDFASAKALIEQFRAMKPPLAQQFTDDLDRIFQDVQPRVTDTPAGPASASPASSLGPLSAGRLAVAVAVNAAGATVPAPR